MKLELTLSQTHGGVLHYLTEDWTDHAKFEV